MKPRALILQARGTNRDQDVMTALNLAGANPEGIPLNTLRVDKKRFRDYDMLVVAGGFSYADALGAGKLLALDLRTYFTDEVTEFVNAKKPVIGICNGFQALMKTGIFEGIDNDTPQLKSSLQSEKSKAVDANQNPALFPDEANSFTLTFNESGHFECRWVTLQPISQSCIWTRNLSELIECPVSHGEGNLQVENAAVLNKLVIRDQIALVYVNSAGEPANGDYPANPNGSTLDIAGICNQLGNVLGLMPHPENHVYSYQHPRHTRGTAGNSGLELFRAGVAYASNL